MTLQSFALFLRGINVGGKNKIAMKDLTKICEGLGASSVQTYVQSGNVMCRADAKDFAERLQQELRNELNLEVPVVVRTKKELEAIVAKNPFAQHQGEDQKLMVMFLKDKPSKERIAELDPNRSPPDEYHLLGQEVFAFFPDGIARSKLTNAYFDSKLKTISTVRNWRTVNAVLQRMT